jgi:glycosyltransferase involved in cell wall biosynthesis
MTVRVSAIVPVRNGSEFLEATLRSILDQTVPVGELIVVDDGSTDDSIAIVRAVAPEAHLITQDRGGQAAARNTGASLASGEWLAFCDHDDMWPQARTAALLAVADAAISYVCGRVMLRMEAGISPSSRVAGVHGSHVPQLVSSALIRRQLWLDLGGMTQEHDVGEDTDFFLRVRELGITARLIEAPTVEYRLHRTNYTASRVDQSAELLDIMRASIRRRRVRQTTSDEASTGGA